MADVDGEFYSSGQSPTTPAVVSASAKDSNVRPHGEMLKMMNPTPNGYSNVPNHKPKSDGQDKKHEGKNSIDHKHSSDHVKKKDEESKHKSSHSKSKESSKEGKKESHDKHVDKEKKHSSSHKESSKTKDSSHKHSEHSKHSSEKKEEKHKSDSIKKEHHSSDGKPKTDNFKENEKVKDSNKEGKHKEHKEKHKDKHKDKEHKEKHKDKSSSSGSSDKPKEKSEKPKEKSDKPKEENIEKHHKDKHENIEKHKEKHENSEKHKEKHENSEKHKEKHKDKHSEKHKDKHGEKHKHKEHKEKIKIKEEPVEKSQSSVKEPSAKGIKKEQLSDDDIPLAARQASLESSKSIKREPVDSDDEPLSSRMGKKIKTDKVKKKKPKEEDDDYEMKEEKPKKKRKVESDDDDYDTKKPVKKVKKEKIVSKIKQEPVTTASPKKRGKKEEEEQEVWKWWEEEKLEDGLKWKTLQHNGPVFAPAYERVPKNVKFYYDGKHMELSEVAEEVAGFYGRMLDHDYTSKDVFNTNFFKDWRKVMIPAEREIIKDLKKCNFNNFNDYYKLKSEERKAMTKEEKLAIKKENEALTAKYGFCIIDGHKQKIGNFKIEPPGLFRGRGEHPKMGMLKRRVEAEDVSINIGREAKVPDPPPGHKWKEVRYDNTVSWLASWSENILGSIKYIMLNPSSKLKGEKDWQKYETARKLKAHAGRIRDEYSRDFKSKEMKVRQRAVALYFIDKLALRAGNEKDEDTADTVGCCSLRVEHITLDDEKDGQEYVVSFDFLGKDSIRYTNSVAVEKRAYKNLKLFMENKQPGDDLFDRLNTAILNKYLNDLMEGLTAKVFRTYNASKTLQEQLDLLTKEEMSVPEKILAYNRANRAVAILCNHQRAVPKGFDKSMDALKTKMDDKINQIKEFKRELKDAKQAAKNGGGKDKMLFDKKKKRLAQLEEQFQKLEVQATDKEENKQIALGTSKLNYLDPRISVAWCKKWSVPIEKVYNRTQRDKFRWAIEMAGPDYKF